MSSLNHHFGSPSMALITENVDGATALRRSLARLRAKCRHFLCLVVNGEHELYRARTDTKIYQQCLLCGYETTGWTIDRCDRRLHLAAKHTTPP